MVEPNAIMIPFEISSCDPDSKARAGILTTGHGIIETPVFMPVGTHGCVKTLSPDDLESCGAQIILANTYHLHLRPGEELIQQANGLHRFISWNKPILTDSGGYQVFSLSDLNKIKNEGVYFKSHYDGSYHMFTPHKVIEIQRRLGVDIMMPLDYPIHYPAGYEDTLRALRLTHQWAEASLEASNILPTIYPFKQYLFGIIQGGVYHQLRDESMKALTNLPFDGYAIGGLSVGEPKETLYSFTRYCADGLPSNMPRYLMGLGEPLDLIESIRSGIDMFDCVIPTRNGRNGWMYTSRGKLVIRNSKYKNDFSPVDPDCSCYACRNFSRAYLRHLFHVGEMLGLRLASLHNICFFIGLVRESRQAIINGNFNSWACQFKTNYLAMGES